MAEQIVRNCFPNRAADEWERRSNQVVSSEVLGSSKSRLGRFTDEDDGWKWAGLFHARTAATGRSDGFLQLPVHSSFLRLALFLSSYLDWRLEVKYIGENNNENKI